MKNKRLIDYISKVSIFSALSFILYLFPKFPLPFFPSFLEVQFSNLPAILGGFVLGPIGGVIIVVVRFVLKLIFTLSSSFSLLFALYARLFIVFTLTDFREDATAGTFALPTFQCAFQGFVFADSDFHSFLPPLCERHCVEFMTRKILYS